MPRLSSRAVLTSLTLALVLGLSGAMWSLGCGGDDAETAQDAVDGGTLRRDASPVEPTEAGPAVDAGATSPAPTCARYCDLVMENCTDDSAQYASRDECLAFCAHLPLDPPSTDVKAAGSVACRQYWADTPARTSPETYCLAAGPFGGNTCGDRCTAFCGVLLSACSPDAGTGAYESQPECATACAGFTYLDGGTDGGGEGPDGPDAGDTLNCRLYWLRGTTLDPASCALLGPKGEACR